MINVWEHHHADEEAAHFCEIHDIAGTVLLDEPGTYVEAVGVRGVPTNLLVDEHGIVRAVGATSPEEISAALTELLGEEITGLGSPGWA